MDLKEDSRRADKPSTRIFEKVDPVNKWPAFSVEEAEQSLIVQVELPGLSADQIDVSMVGNSLMIRRENHAERKPNQPENPTTASIIGSSSRLQDCLKTVSLAADSHANILLVGETGTGKELFARAIHEASSRKSGPLAVVDCTSLPKDLVESLLFGHAKGSFTSAGAAREGLIRQAHTGTLFLDEVGELPLTLQKVFLRVLDEHRFRPLGSEQEIDSDFRLVAATNRNLEQMVDRGQFRADLLFRLRSYLIELPPLRERADDVMELADYHQNRLCNRYQITPKRFASDFLKMLTHYPWPGNVRELVNALEHALFAAKHETLLFAKHLPNHIRTHVMKSTLRRHAISRPDLTRSFMRELPNLHDFREDIFCQAETQYLHDLMNLSNKDIHAACQLSGLSRSRLYALLKKHDISRLQ
jgi:two-component system NtrC family response regulator